MHEFSITEDMLSIALEQAQRIGARRITGIDVVIGDLSGITDDSIQFYFDLLSRGTLADGAKLNFRHEQAAATCLDCGLGFEVGAVPALTCPACESARIQVMAGSKLYVESIEVDYESTAPQMNT